MRALLFLLPGLGDALVASPLIAGAQRAGWELDVLAMLEPVAEYARALPAVHEVAYFDLMAGKSAALPAVARLRRKRYDVGLLPFPATRWEYHALAAAAGSRRLYAHDYGGLARALDVLVRATLVTLSGGHRLAENARLATAAGLTAGAYAYQVPVGWRAQRTPGLFGVHPGTMLYKGNERRRWPVERFAAVIARQAAAGRRVRLFIGPAERAQAPALLAAAGTASAVEVVDAPLERAARALAECEVLLCNDAGFAHLGAALGVKTVVLFGMTDPVRAQPLGPSIALRPSDCPPCHDEGMSTFACVRDIGYRCIRTDLGVDAVNAAISRAFAADMQPFRPAAGGPFRLYGRARNTTAANASERTSQTSADPCDAASGS